MTEERSFQPTSPEDLKTLAEREADENVVDQQTAAAAETAGEGGDADRGDDTPAATNDGRLDRGADPAEGRR